MQQILSNTVRSDCNSTCKSLLHVNCVQIRCNLPLCNDKWVTQIPTNVAINKTPIASQTLMNKTNEQE